MEVGVSGHGVRARGSVSRGPVLEGLGSGRVARCTPRVVLPCSNYRKMIFLGGRFS